MGRLTCKDASALLSRARETRLGAGERLWLRLHLLLCDGCRNFDRSLSFMQAAVRRFLDRGGR